jgi:hypothetical protein
MINDPLIEALAGEPVTVTLGGIDYPLRYPMQAVILYKKETAALDRERKRALIYPSLNREQKSELRERRRQLLEEADGLRPTKGEPWDEANWAKFDELLGDAVAAKTALDQDAGAGDSLYDKGNWWKISPEGDPERLLLALWVGLHKFVGAESDRAAMPAVRKYVESLTLPQLGELVDLGNGEDLTVAISKALRAHLIAAPEPGDKSPNVPTPGAPAETIGK